MSKEKRRVPKLRFPGFTEDWEQRKFGELFILKSGVAFKLSEYTKTGIPIINGESIKAGKISLEKINYLPNEYQYKYQECLLFPGDIVLGLNRPIIDGTLKISRIPADIKKSLLYQRAGKIIFKVNMDENFTYQLLSKEVLTFTKKEAVGSDQPFITTTKLNKWDLYFPVKDKERRNIGSLFNNIDNIITLHQRKLNNLKLKKKALLQKLFPKNEERYPELRFPGFTDAWEQRKFKDIAFKRGKISEADLPYVEFEDINSGIGTLNKNISQKVGHKKGLLFEAGDVLFGKLRPYLQNWLLCQFAGIAVGDFWVLQPQNVSSAFLYYLIQSEAYQSVANISSGTKMPRSSWPLVSETLFSIPKYKEANMIGEFFLLIDRTITLHQRKLDHLQLQKKALLQQMFV